MFNLSGFVVKFEKGFSNIAHDEKLSAEDEKAFREGQRLADTHFLSEKERREWGIPKRYPSDKPGVFMHQKGVLDFLKITPRSWWLKKDLMALSPMFGMVFFGLALSAWTLYNNSTHPSVVWKHKREKGLRELDEPEEVVRESEAYMHRNPIRKIALETEHLPLTEIPKVKFRELVEDGKKNRKENGN